MRVRGGFRSSVAVLSVAVAAVVLNASATAQEQVALRGGASRAFRQANALYSEERFDEAAATYEAILDAGFENADVEYNLGNAHYKSGRLGRAVLAYERALRLEPAHEDAIANLAFVSELLADRRVPVGGAVSEFLARGSTGFTVDRLALASSFFYFALFGVLVAGVLRGGLAGWPGRLAAVLAVCLAVAGGALAYRVVQARENVEAVVLSQEVGVRTGPGEDFVLEFRLHEGTKVRLDESRGEWARVSVSGTDLEGWLPAGTIEEI